MLCDSDRSVIVIEDEEQKSHEPGCHILWWLILLYEN